MWKSEKALVDSFAAQMLATRHCSDPIRRCIWREVRTRYGRPDILIVEYDERVASFAGGRRCTSDSHPLLGYAMAYLTERRWVGAGVLKDFLNCSTAQFTRLMDELMAGDLVRCRDQTIIARPRRQCLAIRRLLAYEAKLSKWAAAIEQAQRHLWFTRDSYILLPHASTDAPVIAECQLRGLGLATHSSDGSTRMVIRPPSHGAMNTPLLWMLNEELLRCIKDDKTTGISAVEPDSGAPLFGENR